MEKRGLFLFIIILSISFVSAQSTLGDILEAFGGENLLLFGAFIISFVLINFILGRLPFFIKDKYTGERSKVVPAVTALIISLFIVYGMNRFNFDLSNFFFNIGLSAELLEVLIIFVILGGLGLLFWKFKTKVFLFLGIILVIIPIFTDWVYKKDTVFIIGLGLIGLYFLIRIFSKKKEKIDRVPDYTPSYEDKYGYERARRAQIEKERYLERKKQQKELQEIHREKAEKRRLEIQQQRWEEQKRRWEEQRARVAGRRQEIEKQRRGKRGERIEEARKKAEERAEEKAKKEQKRAEERERERMRERERAREYHRKQAEEEKREAEERKVMSRALNKYLQRCIGPKGAINPNKYPSNSPSRDLAEKYYNSIEQLYHEANQYPGREKEYVNEMGRRVKEFQQKIVELESMRLQEEKQAKIRAQEKAMWEKREAEKIRAQEKAMWEKESKIRKREAEEEKMWREREAEQRRAREAAAKMMRTQLALPKGRRLALPPGRPPIPMGPGTRDPGQLQAEYDYYKKLIYKWGRVPSKEKNPEGYNEYITYYRELERIRNEARQRGIKLR